MSAALRRHAMPVREVAVCRTCGLTWNGDRANLDGSGHAASLQHVVVITATRQTVLRPPQEPT